MPGASAAKIGTRCLHLLLLTSDHHAVATFQSPRTFTRAYVHVMNFLRGKLLRARDVVYVIGVASVMRMSPASSNATRSAILLVATAAGTINQMARGFFGFFTRSASDDAPTAFSFARFATACADRSYTRIGGRS